MGLPFRAICWGGRCPGGGTGVVFNFFVSTFKGCSSSSSSESCKPYLEKCATCVTRRTKVSQLRNKSSGTYFQKAPTMSWCNCQLYRAVVAGGTNPASVWNTCCTSAFRGSQNGGGSPLGHPQSTVSPTK